MKKLILRILSYQLILTCVFATVLETATRRERSGSVVDCLTRDREVAGSSLTGVTVLWSLTKTH